MQIARKRRRLGILGLAALLLLLASCAPALHGTSEEALKLAAAQGVPLVVDEVQIYNGPSNDTYVRAQLTAVEGTPIANVVIVSGFRGSSGGLLESRVDNSTRFDLNLGTHFDSQHVGQWGPFFVGSSAFCLDIAEIEVRLVSGKTIKMVRSEELRAATSFARGNICR